MKKSLKMLLKTAIAVIGISALIGCTGINEVDVGIQHDSFLVSESIPKEEIQKFYWTYSNINYDACYQRYLFFASEDGKHYFFHETREKPGDYGWLTEEDTTKIGLIELTEEQWADFYDQIDEGEVLPREESADSGDSGPWYYMYWTKDKGKYQEYRFVSYEAAAAYEKYCINLVENSTSLPEDEWPAFDR